MPKATDPDAIPEDDITQVAVDRVRDILIGTQMRDFAAQIHQLETRLCESIDVARQSSESRLKHMETLLHRELTAVSVEHHRLSENYAAVCTAVEEFQNEIHNELHVGMRELDQRFGAAVAKLHRQFDARLTGLLEKLEGHRHGLREAVSREVKRLLDNERFRDSLAKLVIDIVRESNPVNLTPQERERMISKLAYIRAEQRGFAAGDPEQDWREAEAEVDRVITLALEARNAGLQAAEVKLHSQGRFNK